MTENGQKYHPLHADRQNIDDSQPPANGPASVWGTLGMLASRLKAITGRSTWRDEPPTNLTEAHAHQQNKENPHNTTRAQLGAAAQTALDSHTANQLNPHAVTAAQAGAPPTTRTISTSAPLSGGGSLAANRTLSISEATTSAPGSMSAADKNKLDSSVSVFDYGAVGDGVTDDRAAFQAALDASLCVNVPSGNYRIHGALSLHDFSIFRGSGLYGDSGTTGRTGATKLIFTGSATACLSAVDATTTLLHAGLSDMAIHASGSYSWILDLPTLAGWKMANLRMEPTSTSCGGVRAKKINAGDSSWVVNAYDVQVRLPDGSTSYNMDVDCSDGAFVGGSLTGGKGAILRGTGGFKLLGTRLDRSNQWGLVIAVETEARSQHIVNGCQIEENASGGILVDGDANNALSQTWVGFVIANNAFRNPHPGAADIELRNYQVPVLRGGVIGPNAHNTTATPIKYNPGGWTDLTILPGGVHQGSGAPNFYAGGKFLQSPLVLAQSAVPISHTGTTTETTLTAITIPAKAMGLNGRLRITSIWSCTSSSGSKTLKMVYGGQGIMNVGIAANNSGFRGYTEVANRNSYTSQVVAHPAHAAFGQGAFAPMGRATDTSVDQNLTLGVVLGDASDTITLESYLIELLPGIGI